MRIPWQKHPSGANAVLFDGTMHVVITKNAKGWDASLSLVPAVGGGALFPVRGAKSVDAAMKGFDTWLTGCISGLFGSTLVWENECRLVINSERNGRYKTGEMGLCYPKEGTEIQICVSSWDDSAKHKVFSKLENVPVRVSLERVPGGNE